MRSGTFPGGTMGATIIPSQQSVSVYQHSSGTIKGGVVYITLYATSPAGISYASIQGTNYCAPSTSIFHQQLMQGVNQVVINYTLIHHNR